MKLQPPRGTKDLIGPAAAAFRFIDQKAWEIAQRFGYQEISTPIIESTDVFKRSLGETTDIITKEMYTFDDRGGDSITLRPEGTAGVARAFISNGMDRQLPLRFYYNGPMFRYERPQKGRQRQFHQLGAEVLGLDTAEADVEAISFGYMFLNALGLAEKIQLEINTLGDQESRQAYRQALVAHFEKHRERLSADSQNRLQTNPLRILDSKDEQDRPFIDTAPAFDDYLNEKSKHFFTKVQNGLQITGIPFVRNVKLVRGLDYYCHTVFEFTTNELGSQNAVLSGGRYDGLIQAMGGRPTPGIGWAAGIERLSMLVGEEAVAKTPPPVALLPLGEEAQLKALRIAYELRSAGLNVETFYSGSNLGKLMKKADGIGASAAVILGEDELKSREVTVKNMKTGEQRKIGIAELKGFLLNR